LLRRFGRPARSTEELAGLQGDLFGALRDLPQHQAHLLVLRYHHGYSNRELAAALGIPETTLGSRLAAARRALEAVLERNGVVIRQPSRVVPGEERS